MIPISPPFQIYNDTLGNPLQNGYVYIGVVNQNPQTFPVAVFYDEAGTQPAAQPLRTINGYVINGSSPTNIFVNGDFSITIRDVSMSLVESALSASAAGYYAAALAGPDGAGLVGYVANTSYPANTVGDSMNQMGTQITSLIITQAEVEGILARENDAMQQLAIDLSLGMSRKALCCGDSTTLGTNGAPPPTVVVVPWPMQTQNFINAYYGVSVLTCVNVAVGGSTAAQMIAGTDGSGSTLAQKLATGGYTIAYFSYGINDIGGALSSFTTAMTEAAAECRAATPPVVPIFVTEPPTIVLGANGSPGHAYNVGVFAEAMREVARANNVILVDNYEYIQKYISLAVPPTLALSVIPDGYHPIQAAYTMMGNNCAEPILASQAFRFTGPKQFMPMAWNYAFATNQGYTQDNSSRVGVAASTNTAANQSMRVCFRVDQPGLDLYIAGQVWSVGSPDISLSFDGLATYPFSQYVAGFGATYAHDVPTQIASNIPIGFHYVTLTATTNGIGLNFLMSEAYNTPTISTSPGGTNVRQSVMLTEKIVNSGVVADVICFYDNLPVSHLVAPYTIEFTSQLMTQSGVVVGANIGSNAALVGTERLLTFGLNASGFLTVSEATGPGTYTDYVIDAVDHSGGSVTYRVNVINNMPGTNPGAISIWINDVPIGSHTLVNPYYGGLLGSWKHSNAGTLTITNLCEVYSV